MVVTRFIAEECDKKLFHLSTGASVLESLSQMPWQIVKGIAEDTFFWPLVRLPSFVFTFLPRHEKIYSALAAEESDLIGRLEPRYGDSANERNWE